jgi:hypothetical protein
LPQARSDVDGLLAGGQRLLAPRGKPIGAPLESRRLCDKKALPIALTSSGGEEPISLRPVSQVSTRIREMSRGFPSMTALLGLLAIAGYQNRDKIAEMLSGLGKTTPGAAGRVASAVCRPA